MAFSRASTPEDEKTYGIDDPPPSDLGLGGPPSSWRPLLHAGFRQQSDTTGDRQRRLRRDNAMDEEDTLMLCPRIPMLSRSTFNMSADHGLNEKYIELHKYRLMQEIGQGSYGVVKLAFSQQDNKLYALKVLDKLKLMKNMACFRRPPPRKGRTTNWADPLHMIYKEIAILRKLEHANVVKLCDVLDEPNQNYLYLVFEYMERGAVMESLPCTAFEEVQAWKYFREVFMGLEYLHHQKIIHRDIKPGNLLLATDNTLKIADFGVSCEFSGIDAFLTSTAGTPAFMAPESLFLLEQPTTEMERIYQKKMHMRLPEDQQAKVITGVPLPCFSGKSQDIWALGTTLYAFVYGEAPFWDPYVLGLHRKIKFSRVKYPGANKEGQPISKQCVHFIKKMLDKDPDKRCDLFELEMDEWLTGEGEYPLNVDVKNIPIIRVTKKEIASSIRVFTSLGTLILIKSMGHRRRLRPPSVGEAQRKKEAVLRRKSGSMKDPTYMSPSDDPYSDGNHLRPDRPSESTVDGMPPRSASLSRGELKSSSTRN